MSENKRFKLVHNKRKGQLFITDDFYDNGDDYFPHNLDYDECIRLLNDLYTENEELKKEIIKLKKENEQLKQAYTQLKHRHSLLHDVCIDAECDRDSYHEDIASLEKENEGLKEKSNDKQEHIVHLENKIHRMRKEIKKLEGLYHYAGCEGTSEMKVEGYQLKKENEHLKKSIKQYVALGDEYLQEVRKLSKENEQLKQFKEDVFSKIDMHLRMLPTARDNEFNEYDGDPSLYTGAIYMLETLKKELEE